MSVIIDNSYGLLMIVIILLEFFIPIYFFFIMSFNNIIFMTFNGRFKDFINYVYICVAF